MNSADEGDTLESTTALGTVRDLWSFRWMEESLPAAAVPDENAAHEEADLEDDQLAREHKRSRVPSSVLLTLLAAPLSVWVAPAFARQWDERQKARESAGCSRSGRCCIDYRRDRRRIGCANRGGVAPPDGRAKEWDTARARLEAELRVYYPENAVIQHWYLRVDGHCGSPAHGSRSSRGLRGGVRSASGHSAGHYQGALARQYLIDLFYQKPASRSDTLPPGTRERAKKRGDDYARWVFDARDSQDPGVFSRSCCAGCLRREFDTTLAHILKTTPEGLQHHSPSTCFATCSHRTTFQAKL